MAKIASFNINGVRARLPNLLTWLKSARPDVALLQEIKCVDESFPELEIGDLGYNLAVHGQKSFNGVAILSKWNLPRLSGAAAESRRSGRQEDGRQEN